MKRAGASIIAHHKRQASLHKKAIITEPHRADYHKSEMQKHQKMAARYKPKARKIGVKKADKFDYDKNGKLDAHERAHKDEAKVIAKLKKKVKRRY